MADRYVHGTSARKIEYNVYEENKVLREKKKAKKNYKIKARMVLALMAVFVMGFIILGRYATLTQLNYSISEYKSEYNDIVDKNVKLNVDIQSKTDLDKVRQVAEQKLGMTKPDKNQIVYVDVPKSDFTLLNDKYTESRPTGQGLSISTLFYNIGKFIGFM